MADGVRFPRQAMIMMGWWLSQRTPTLSDTVLFIHKLFPQPHSSQFIYLQFNMISIHRLLLVAISLARFHGSVHGFVVAPTARAPLVTSTIHHHNHGRSDTELAASSKRRDLFGNLKKVFFAGGAMSFFKSSEPALAEDATPSPVTGKVVVMEIGNVGGEEGKTGTIKIQLHPEWAPIGTKRFEQLTEANFWDGCR